MSRQPRILLLAWAFPPYNLIGAVRAWNMAKYLARTGWRVTVVTPHESYWRTSDGYCRLHEELQREGIGRIQTAHLWRWLVPWDMKCSTHGLGWLAGKPCRKVLEQLNADMCMGWSAGIHQACARLTADDVDIVLATGPPFMAFQAAKRLADRMACPYVLDYRDAWTQNPHQVRSAPLSGRAEARLLAGCAAVTTVSESLASVLQGRAELSHKLHVVTNGYDPEELASVRPYPFGHFAIVYTGSFYPPKRVITPVMAALQRLTQIARPSGPEWQFHYYGWDTEHVQEAARQFGVQTKVVTHGEVSRQEALSAVRGAGAAVVITSVAAESSLADRGIVTGKIFEPLGLKTPTLVIAPSGSDVESMADTAGLARCVPGTDIEGMARFLDDLMSGRSPASNDPEVYAWPTLGEKLDAVLRNVLWKQRGTAVAGLPATELERRSG